MLSRKAKAAFYMTAGPMMRLNGLIHKHLRMSRDDRLKVQLGPGRENYLPGWVNVDANMFTGKCDVWADLTNPLPFHDGTVEAMYSHHVVEHLPSLERHFEDAFRCLRPGGVYRVAGPNGDTAIRKYLANDLTWFGVWPDARESIGGRFENFIFCRREHLTILTPSFLEELLKRAGFTRIEQHKAKLTTGRPDLFADCLEKEWETNEEFPYTLVLEAHKAGDA